MIRWINRPWKQVIGYWLLSKNDNSSLTHEIMEETVVKLFEVNLIVKALICDQGPRNQGMFKKHKMTPTKPFFKVPGYDHKIYFIYDPPHLLKSIRNNLFKKHFKYDGGYARWSVLEKIFSLSKESPLHLIPKITERHLYNISNGDKMSVSLAAQVFSKSMYTAHLVYTTIDASNFPEDDTTGKMIWDLDRLFDSLNSRLERPILESLEKLNYAISKDSKHHEFLRNMIDKLDKSSFVQNKDSDKARPPCLNGFKITINSVLQLSEELRVEYDIPILKTRQLNQDPLENLFATIRQQHGCSVNPSPKQFESGLRHIFITQLSKLSNATNCEEDQNKIFAKLSKIESATILIPVKEFLNNKLSVPSIMNNFENDMKRTKKSEFTESNAVYYICGYLAKKFIKSHNTCRQCVDYLILPRENKSFEDYKLFTLLKDCADANGLKYSSKILFDSVLEWEKTYQSVIKNFFHLKKISCYLNPVLIDRTPKFKLCTEKATNAFINSFIKIRCFWEARFRRRAAKSADTNTKQKVKKSKMKKFTNKNTICQKVKKVIPSNEAKNIQPSEK
ncbi:uncharacterized protein LOC123301372 [Chrysoperla carnea]|uniref:uncharacterized protein LOC123301372 n=1 Tax=Chrysoperla carnea TaxID=189513 RepID=UPI001D086980|nr:uncharacterized protein LOC123301372 [Chrysoperla carnea]